MKLLYIIPIIHLLYIHTFPRYYYINFNSSKVKLQRFYDFDYINKSKI